MKRVLAATAAGGLALATAFLGAASASAADTATVYVVHGIPDTPVDIYVNGERTLDDFQPETVAGPLDLPAGSYKVDITAADAADDSSPLLSTTADLKGGDNVSLVANLDASGNPTVNAFVNDVSTVKAGESRVVVRHVAAAPAVDVRAGGKVVLSNVTNPNEGTLTVPAGTVSADVTLAGTDTVVIGPADLKLAEGTATFVHAVGSADQGTLGLVSFTVSGLHSSPGGVPAGTGPADNAWALPLAGVVLVGGVALLLTSGRRLRADKSA